ncbi:hypothetical protein KJ365_07085 [Glaciecola sp. XM2]|uniref:glycosyltransferase n=1 Tax=Glaciecola sp. XM2 TaxID=1914931 RepID=UPI001BDE1FF8|nr:hypothetical protein [Glaciecola sp. XM2]MBT1450644.1 hypothetical protein [Glaciecola sp. XM2]
MKQKILFISYFYPPVAGQGLPGTNRSVKFIRNIERLEKVVLTVKPEDYVDYVSLDYPSPLPINNEVIYRTSTFDIFKFLLSVKNVFKSRQKIAGDTQHKDSTRLNEGSNNKTSQNKSIYQKGKDLISDVLRYPDLESAWIIPAFRKGRAILKKERIDFIFATGKPWSSLIIALLLKGEDTKLIIDFRDPWVGNPFDSKDSLIRRKLDPFFEKKVVHAADFVFLNTEHLREEFVARYPNKNSNQFVTVTNGFDSSELAEHLNFDTKSLDKAYSEDTLVVSHAGLLYGLRDPSSVLEALSNGIKEYDSNVMDKVMLQQIGGFSLGYDLDKKVRDLGVVGKFKNLGSVPYDKCLQLLSASDILLIIQPETKTQIPSKLYEYIYLDKPILTIAPLDGALGQLVKRYSFGDIFSPEDIESISKYLFEKAKEKQELGYLKCNYQHKSQFDIKNISKKIEHLLLD